MANSDIAYAPGQAKLGQAPAYQGLAGTFTRDGKTYSSPYANTTGYQEAFNKYIDYNGTIHSDSEPVRQAIIKELDAAANQFKSLFTSNVGRAPTSDEISKFMEESGASTSQQGVKGEALRNQIVQYVGDNFQPEAQKVAQDKTAALIPQYNSLADSVSAAGNKDLGTLSSDLNTTSADLTAKNASLADQFTALGKQSLGDLSTSLQTFASSLFDKLRPQLNLSAQAGGYADSGGQTLQEQGALKDLAASGQISLADATNKLISNASAIRYGGTVDRNAQDAQTLDNARAALASTATNIRSGGMGAPLSLASTFAANQPGVLSANSGGALDFGNRLFNTDNSYQNQLKLMNAQNLFAQNYAENTRPSFGQNLSDSFSKGLGTSLSNTFNPSTYIKAK